METKALSRPRRKARFLAAFVALSIAAVLLPFGQVSAYAADGSYDSATGGTMLSNDALNRCIVRLHPHDQISAVNVEDNGNGRNDKHVWLYSIGDSSRLFLWKANGSENSYTVSFFNGSGTDQAADRRFAVVDNEISAVKRNKGVDCENFQLIQNDDGTYYVYCKKYGKYWGLKDSGYDNKNRVKLVSLKDAQKWDMEIVGHALETVDLGAIKSQYDSFTFANGGGELVTANNWMSKLPGGMRLSDVCIPGAHDSGTANVSMNHAAQCQQFDYTDMLNAGLRYFDLRIGPDTCIVHNSTTCYYRGEIMNLGDVENMIDQFLNENPGETVILQVKIDRGGYEAQGDAMLEFQKWVKSGRVWCGDHVPTLGECRGKVVIISRFTSPYRIVVGDDGQPHTIKEAIDYTLDGYGQWALDAEYWVDSAEQTTGLVCSGDNYEVWTQDNYGKVGDTKEHYWTNSIFHETKGAQARRDAAASIGKNAWVISYTSCTIFGEAKYPQEMARDQNPRLISALRKNLETGDRTFIGVICSDFSDEMLAQLVYRHNFAVQHVTVRGITVDGEEPLLPVTFEMVPGTSAAYLINRYSEIEAYFSRNGDYQPHDATSIGGMLHRNPMTSYASAQEYAADKLDMASLPASGDYTLYVALDKPVKYSVSLNLAAPGCTDTVSGVDGDDWSGQTPKPVFQTVKGAHYGVVEVDGDQRAYWVADAEATSALIGGLDVSLKYAYAEIEADFGYCFTSGKASVTYDTVSGTRPLSNCKATLRDARHMQVIVQADGVSHDLKKIEGTEPTCVDPGMHEHYQCETCGKLFLSTKSNASPVSEDSLRIPATGEHTAGTPQVENRVEPTCLAAGSYDIVCRCTVCDEVLSSEHRALAATGHVWDEGTVVKQATCTEAGALRRVCEHCGTGRTEEIPALGHDWGEWVVAKEATETEAGEEVRTCSHDASHVETRAIPLADHEHVLTHMEANPATCETAGNIEYWVCDQGANPCRRYFKDAEGNVEITQSDTIIAAGHIWDAGAITTPVGCTTDGVMTYTCTRDSSHTKTETIPAQGHKGNYEDKTVQITTAGCVQTEYSYQVHYCVDCGEVLTNRLVRTGDSLGHDWGKPVYTWADDDAVVIATRTCNRDADHPHIESEVAEVLVDVVEPATCEAPGKEILTAAFENEAFATQTKEREVAALGHEWDEGVVTAEPTCTVDGVLTYTCANDATHARTEGIPATGHVLVSVVVDGTDTATCTEDGVCDVQTVCAECGEVFGTEQAETYAFGHHWDAPVYEWSDDLAEVTATHTCLTCGEVETETVGVDAEVEVEPTCEGEGEETLYSASFEILDFEIQEKTRTVAALGHDWGPWVVTKEPTETEEGVETRTCTRDASHTETRAIPAKGSGEAGEEATLTFDLAGGTLDGQTGTVTVAAKVGDTVNLPGAPAREGYTFKFWRGSEYAAGAAYTVEGDHSFTAEWEAAAEPEPQPGNDPEPGTDPASPSDSEQQGGKVIPSKAATPKTGDSAPLLAGGLALCALAGLALAVRRLRKEH